MSSDLIALADMSCTSHKCTTYQHNPYAFNPLYEDDSNVALKSCFELYNIGEDFALNSTLSDHTKAASYIVKKEADNEQMCTAESVNGINYGNIQNDKIKQISVVRDSTDLSFDIADEGVSEASSEHGCTQQRESTLMMTNRSINDNNNSMFLDNFNPAQKILDILPSASNSFGLSYSYSNSATLPVQNNSLVEVTNELVPELRPVKLPSSTFRYASVNFRFGSAWFVAPFRTFIGDMVVVEYRGNNNSLHMGLVSAITTEKPVTFYSDANTDPNYLTEAELRALPTILRHARDFDKETKLDLRSHDLRALANAQALAAEMKAPVSFIDAEWLLDLSAVTFLVHVFGDVSLVDRLADELAAQEGAEVVFTYPAINSAMEA